MFIAPSVVPSTARLSRRLVPVLIVLLSAGPALAEDTHIQNDQVRVRLSVSDSINWWRLSIHARQEEQWRETVIIGIGGVFSTKELQTEYRQKLRTYYPLQQSMPANVVQAEFNDRIVLSFRLIRDDLWMDVRLTLLKKENIVLVESPGASRPELLPETGLRFTEPVFGLIADGDAPSFRREWKARDYRNQSLHCFFDHYMAPFGPTMGVVPMVLSLPNSAPRKAHWSRGGLTTLYLKTPYLLAFDFADYERTAHSVHHRAVGMISCIRTIFEGNND